MDKHNRSVSTNIFYVAVDIFFTALYFCALYYLTMPSEEYNIYLCLYLSFLLEIEVVIKELSLISFSFPLLYVAHILSK